MGNDMFNDEQLKHAEILQKETEDALGFWKDRALKAEAKLADKYLIEEQYEAACGDRDGLLRMVETLRGQKDKLQAERDALLSRPAPPADAAREAVPSMVALRGAIPDLVRGAVPDFPPYQTIPPEITARLDVAETALEEIIAESERWHDDGWTGAHVAFTALGGRKRRALSSPAPAPTTKGGPDAA